MVPANLTNAVRKAVYKRDGYACAPGASRFTTQSTVPRAEGTATITL